MSSITQETQQTEIFFRLRYNPHFPTWEYQSKKTQSFEKKMALGILLVETY